MSTELYYKSLVIYILLLSALAGILNVDIISSQLKFIDTYFRSSIFQSLQVFIAFSLYIHWAMALFIVYWLSFAAILCLPTVLLNRLHFPKSGLIGLNILVSFLGIALLSVDQFIYHHFQFHLNAYIFKILCSTHINDIIQISSSEIAYIILKSAMLFIICCGLFFVAIKLAYHTHNPKLLNNFLIFWFGLLCWLVIFIHSAISMNATEVIHELDYYPGLKVLFYKTLKQPERLIKLSEWGAYVHINQSGNLKWPKDKDIVLNKPQPPHYNIVWITVDTLRADAITPYITPHLYQFQQREMNFSQHMSSGNSTQAGVFGMFYGLPPNYFSAAVNYHKQPLLFDFMGKAGYQFQIFYSSTLKTPPFRLNLFSQRKPQEIHEVAGIDVGDSDRITTKNAISFLMQQKNSSTPFFSYIFYDAVHGYCQPQSFPLLFPKAIKECKRWEVNATTDPIPYLLRYNNAVHFVDNEISKVLNTLEKNGLLDTTIVIITSDHGEGFNENHNNIWGHCSSYTKDLIHIPLMIHWPHQLKKTIVYSTSHYDLSATLIQELFHSSLYKKYTIGQTLFTPHPKPYLLCGSYVSNAIVCKNTFTVLHPDGDFRTYDKNGLVVYQQRPNPKSLKMALQQMSMFYETH